MEDKEQYRAAKLRVKAYLDKAIEEDLLQNPPQRESWRMFWTVSGTVIGVAACLCAAFVLLMDTYKKNLDERLRSITWSEVSTVYGEKKSVRLPDGTMVWLHNESKIIYPDRFVGSCRQVFSSGEVYADVAKDKAHPFILTSKGVNVCVKGTRFNLRSYSETPEVELTLLEGAVDMKMKLRGEQSSLSVTPGQVIKANLATGEVSKFFCEPTDYVSWSDRETLYFNDETLGQIVTELEMKFDIRIIVKNRSLLSRRYYASFVNGETPLQVLSSLNDSGEMQIRKEGNTYYIY